jgi:hypothetical protein
LEVCDGRDVSSPFTSVLMNKENIQNLGIEPKWEMDEMMEGSDREINGKMIGS